jgi:diguanylate cyclase (GGDEF)-like protein/PAS domain S-box-containing protein
VKAIHPRLAPEGGDEVGALIRTLHETGRRLEELTGGEVDSVMAPDGRAFMLRHAQEQLRDSDNARQAAVLDSLSAHIALLDSQGRIVSVNEAWRRFAGANALLSPSDGLGLSYLEVCENAAARATPGAHEACEGIRSVLAGVAESFSVEYPCHSDTQLRWFQMTATPLGGGGPGGAVVSHSNITKLKLADQALQASLAEYRVAEKEISRAGRALLESERRFTEMLGNVKLAAVMLDRGGRITYCNEYLLGLAGWSRDEVIGQDWFDLFIPPELADLRGGLFASLLGDRTEFRHYENEILTRPGGRRLIRWNNSALRSETGEVIGVAAIGEDITDSKRAEVRIKRLNRVYAVLSGINALIVRVRDRDELFREACRIVLDAGGFRMAMIALVGSDSPAVVPRAWAGITDDLLEDIRVLLSSDDGIARTMSGRAMRQREPVVSNDSRRDPQVVFGKRYLDAGVRSMAVLPLVVADVARGVLAIYSDEAGFFDQEELDLLTELAGDIAFAIDHIEKQDRLDHLAYYDALTGLANRTLFLERVDQSLRGAARGGHKLALFLLDLERFKNINDSLGRPAGDALLKQVAQWLTRNMGDANLVARVDADHFALMLPQVRPDGNLPHLVEKVASAFLEHPFRLDEAVFRLAAKVGVAVYPDDGADPETLFRNAEAALKKAKAGGERYLFHTQKMTEAAAGRLTLENQLRQAVDRGEFVLHYQPKVSLASGKLTGVEALIRWNDPRTGLVPPGRFIPMLEETGLIHEVGRWALRQAIAGYLGWKARGLAAVRVAVNVSPLQLRHRGFIAEIEGLIGIDAQAACGLELEITESLIMEDVRNSIASMQAIRAIGVRVAIDDFGTGFSSLSYLARLPVDTLKIDRSFVLDMTTGPQGLALLSTIINLAHALKLCVVAEGVETEEQSRLLALLGCDEMQGYLFSRPVPGDVFEARFLVPGVGPTMGGVVEAGA